MGNNFRPLEALDNIVGNIETWFWKHPITSTLIIAAIVGVIGGLVKVF